MEEEEEEEEEDCVWRRRNALLPCYVAVAAVGYTVISFLSSFAM